MLYWFINVLLSCPTFELWLLCPQLTVSASRPSPTGHVTKSAALRLWPDYLPSLDHESSLEKVALYLWDIQLHGYLRFFISFGHDARNIEIHDRVAAFKQDSYIY
jgi:hypothetical protein